MTGKSGAAKIGSDLDRLKAVGDDEGSCEGHVPKKITGDGVTAMMGRLKLTTKEAKTFVLDDLSQDAFKDLKWAIMGKIMAPNTYRIQTITSVVTLAWGNPRSLKVTSMGPNMFLAEFPSKIDMQHVLNGSPWVMGKNAILLKEFDPRIQPADVVFDRLLLWVRIYKLSYPLMNTDRGRALAGTIGDVVRVEADENEKAGYHAGIAAVEGREWYFDKGFEKLLKIIKKMLPGENVLPSSTYEAKKVVCPLGLEVQKIHACINDCILYRWEYENLNACPVCSALRYKIRRDDPGDVEGESTPRKRVPAKVMWYAPIIPRLKRLFQNKEHPKLLRWHKEDRKKDVMLRHPADGSQWRKIDREFKSFSDDARNLRFGLSTDGFNPFGSRAPVIAPGQ
ncbi:hypothetical protein QYE76_028756 [Lolium multiflorum]|uniref:DUF4283 domain-containing protein n=1 Tax=Lolium multiflorum TaxID=4521 RepID=A0AAD8QQ50_LOLMU|nr:hypothetical protein QYE76_028756 [Lolium multiflorum]